MIAVGAFQTVQEAGGVDTLKSEIPNRRPPATMTRLRRPPPRVHAAPYGLRRDGRSEPSVDPEPDLTPDGAARRSPDVDPFEG